MPKSKKASVLVYSLIILSVMLMIAAAFTTTSVISRKNASVTSKSSQSFQIADSGSNLMLKMLKDADPSDQLSDLGCTGAGTITFDNTDGLRSGSTAEVTFKDASDNPLNCSANVSDVDSIKSVGKFADTSRAIEVAVAQTAGGGITGGCNITDTGVIQTNFNWGAGCRATGTNVGQSRCDSASDSGYSCGRIAVFGNAASCICVRN